jgi:hypothetical protein
VIQCRAGLAELVLERAQLRLELDSHEAVEASAKFVELVLERREIVHRQGLHAIAQFVDLPLAEALLTFKVLQFAFHFLAEQRKLRLILAGIHFLRIQERLDARGELGFDSVHIGNAVAPRSNIGLHFRGQGMEEGRRRLEARHGTRSLRSWQRSGVGIGRKSGARRVGRHRSVERIRITGWV